MEPTNGSFVPASPDLIRIVFIQQALILIARLVGVVMRRVPKNRMTTSAASTTLTGLTDLWGGLVIAGRIFDSDDLWEPGMIDVAVLVALVVVIVVSLVAAYLHPRPGLDPISEVAKHDESGSPRFKSSARWDMRTGEHDDTMGTVIAKTVAAFMNSGGDALLIGVNDDGRLISMGSGYSTLETPDSDRFELWIRDMWGQRVGTNAAVFPRLDFAEASNPQEGYKRREVCRMTIPPSLRPMYLKGPKDKEEAELWVRVGNSTRRLEVTDTVQYVSTRWPESVRVSPWMRVCLLASHHREVPTYLSGAVERTLTERTMSGLSAVEEGWVTRGVEH